MNATFTLGEQLFCAIDRCDELSQTIGNQLAIWLEIATEEDIQRIYGAVLKGKCLVITSLGDSNWHSSYLKFQDPFGIAWELNCQK